MLEHHVHQLVKDLGLDFSLPQNTNGGYEYYLEEDLPLTLTPIKPEGFIMNAMIGPYPKDREEEFFVHMLNGNLFGHLTLGATLGLSDDGNQIVIWHIVDYRCDYREFRMLLDDFINVVNFWREEAGLIAKEEPSF